MTNNQTFTTLAGFFQGIWNLGDQILIYNGAFQVTLNQFLMGIAIMGLILTALLNFVRYHYAGFGTIMDNSNASTDNPKGSRITDHLVNHRNKTNDEHIDNHNEKTHAGLAYTNYNNEEKA